MADQLPTCGAVSTLALLTRCLKEPVAQAAKEVGQPLLCEGLLTVICSLSSSLLELINNGDVIKLRHLSMPCGISPALSHSQCALLVGIF